MRVHSLAGIFETLEKHSRDRPDAVALVPPRGRPLTYGSLYTAISSAAARLRDAGMRPGDAVAFSVRPSVESIILILATVRAGGVIVAADPGMGSGALRGEDGGGTTGIRDGRNHPLRSFVEPSG